MPFCIEDILQWGTKTQKRPNTEPQGVPEALETLIR